jgi:hypothetical protein
MLKTSKLLTITVPKATYQVIHSEAKRRRTTISGMLRQAFTDYVENDTNIYSDVELQRLLQRDQLSVRLQRKLDRQLRSQRS